jgi:hypothetical protein
VTSEWRCPACGAHLTSRERPACVQCVEVVEPAPLTLTMLATAAVVLEGEDKAIDAMMRANRGLREA